MIKNIHSSSNHIQIGAGYSNVPPMSPGAQSAGMLRYNTSSNTMEVYNGVAWFSVETTADILLSPMAQQAMDWSIKKMEEESRLQSLMARHPGLKELNDKFEMMKVLCQQQENKQ
jgi:hypothetical protein